LRLCRLEPELAGDLRAAQKSGLWIDERIEIPRPAVLGGLRRAHRAPGEQEVPTRHEQRSQRDALDRSVVEFWLDFVERTLDVRPRDSARRTTRFGVGKEPGQDLKEGVYTLPILHAFGGPSGDELKDLLADGPPEGAAFDRALTIVTDPANLAHARAAVVAEVDRARTLADRLPEGPALTALVQLAEFLAARCQARGSGSVSGSQTERGSGGSSSERASASGSPQGKKEARS